MATIPIRDIPEDPYKVLRRRAWAVMAGLRAASDAPGATTDSILADLAADRR
ncbi:hypothetical protein [Mycolicibacterium fallax]|uniref:hypothetical protein n=1 Tax=Mycolicibacterium fallax TaxID=1793 RepID=UPI00138BD0F9|nr:hypothetical protein [Mycolicibacterium fallax]BBY96919.1 hypothetical protein MFAL_03860 [Mycolicibacterium fallax]